MAVRDGVERISYPIFVLSTISTAILALTQIWGENYSELLQRLLWTSLVIAIASLFLLAGARRRPPA